MKISQSLIKHAGEHLEGSDMDFFERVWNSPADNYHDRLKAIDFQNKDCVLDAGFGMGQWTLPYANMNKELFGIEYSEARVKAVKKLMAGIDIDNIHIAQGSIEDLPYDENMFDAVFCYSVLFLTDYKKALQEFYRVLKPGGKLYFTANGLGWYLFCLIENHNKSDSYDPRVMASNTISHTIDVLSGEKIKPGNQVILTHSRLKSVLKDIGFLSMEIGHDGELTVNGNIPAKSFYSQQEYLSYPMIFECIATK